MAARVLGELPASDTEITTKNVVPLAVIDHGTPE
jgi:hypothetical protein